MTPTLASDPYYATLKAYVLEHTGLHYYRDKDDNFSDRIGARLGHNSCRAYLDILRSPEKGDAELDELIVNLTIGETYFFRHKEQFDAMREIVLPEMIRRNQNIRRLRIWSAGCANGAEAFSVAILLLHDFGDQIAGWDITILGTDINREFLARAAEGKFQDWHLRAVPADVKAACFSKSGKEWILVPEYRRLACSKMVSFQYHNLVKHPFPSLLHNLCGFDMILCRNVTIYFEPEIVQTIIRNFRECLVEGGWLLVGHAEPNLEYYRDFEMVTAPGAILYRKGTSPSEIEVPAEWQPPSLEKILVPDQMAAPKESAPPSELDEIRLLADRGESEKALNRCALFIQTNPLNALAHFYEALIREQMGDHVRREASLRRAIYLDRQFVLAHYSLGLVLLKNGNTDNASRSLRNVFALIEGMKDDHAFREADDITVADLRELTQMHLEVIEKR